jgi:hypothetical protein
MVTVARFVVIETQPNLPKVNPMTTQTEIIPTQTAIVPTAATRELTPGIWQMIEKMAPVMHRAHLFGVTSPDQAAAIMLKGYELGLSMTASFELVQVIQGKPALSPRGAMAILLSSPLQNGIRIVRLEDKGKFVGYECYMERTNGFGHTARFTMQDAQIAGLIKPDSGWQKYPENMCLWRAIGFAADVVFPDVTAGMTTLMKAPEMYGVALTEGGDVIDATNVPVVDPLQALIDQYTAEKIYAVYGSIPETPEQIAEAREKLQGNTQ